MANKMDGVTASALLGAVQGGGDVNQVADLFKAFNKFEGGPSQEAREFVAANLGKKCKIKGTSHEGVVHKLNESTSGFYPGHRYPVYVKITNGESIGTVFEYDLPQIEVLE